MINTDSILSEMPIDSTDALQLLSSETDVIELLSTAYVLRKKYFNKAVRIHILNNTQNGYCPEDCHYCVQAKDSKVPIEKYTKKDEAQILKEAENAYKKRIAWYFLIVAHLKNELSFYLGLLKIKDNYPIEVCLSPGLISAEDAAFGCWIGSI